jgi:hypothetical protein
MHIADVAANDNEVAAVLVVYGNFRPVIEFNDGSQVVFTWGDLIKQAVEFKKEKTKETENDKNWKLGRCGQHRQEARRT